MTTPAGWYPEPGGDQQRYWDGEAWTEHVAPLAPTPDAQPSGSADGATPEPALGAAAPLMSSETPPPESGGGGGKGKVVGGIAAAVLVVLAGFFAYSQLASADGGADSPEAAIEDLMAAFSDEDVVGVAEVVLPGERRTYVDPYLEGIGHLQRWGVLSDDLDTSDVDGFEFQVDDLELRTEAVADDVVNVYASGSLTAELIGDDLPIGEVVSDQMDEAPDSEAEETTEFDDVMITTVREDGRWYVSAVFTAAEYLRADSEYAGEALPDPIEPIGAPSADAAIDGMLDAITSYDVEGVVARLNPDEAQVLQRYGPLFLPEAQAEIDEAMADEDVSIEIEVETDIDERDGFAIATFSSISARFEADGEVGEFTADGECTTITVEGETEEVCADGTESGTIDFTDTPAGDLTAMFDDMDTVGLVVVEHDGEWFVSPIRSYTEAILTVMRAIDRDEFDTLLDALEDGSLEMWFEEELERVFGGELEDMVDEVEISPELGGADTYGDDPDLDILWDGCQAGEMADCDDLYWSSSAGSGYEELALTCGGTVPLGDVSGGDCATGEPTVSGDEPAVYGDDPQLDAYWDGCQAGDMIACDDLFWNSGFDTEYEAFAETCGGRIEEETFGDCVGVLGEQVG